ncbi:MAG: response regulator [Lachnospiraceae bacterium]|nr:response regulator [Lachnospiraceae bacterium]
MIIQYCCSVGLFIESWIIIRKWKDKVHVYLFLNCMATLISNVGYLAEMKSATQEAYYVALKFSYAGRVWVAFTMFLFVAELCRIKLPKLLTNGLVLVHLFTYILVFTVQKHDLYYVNPVFTYVAQGIFPKIFKTNGIWYNIHMVIQIAYIVCGLIWIIRAYRKEKHKVGRKRLQMVLCAIIAESFCYILMMCSIPGFTTIYDTTMIGYFIGTIFMLIAIFSYDLLGTREIAREFVIDRISEGIIAADNDGVIQYYNEPAERLYPEIRRAEAAVPPAMLQAVQEEENLTLDGRIYRPEENDLLYEGKSYGKLYALVDETEHFRYMEELKEQRSIADRANKAKSTFLANMSHEIRTPINAVLGMDEMILRETKEDQTYSYAQDIQTAGSTLLSLINDILDFSKIEEGKMEILPMQYELSSAVGDLINMIHSRAEKKGLAFRVDVDPEIPHLLYGDEIRVKQIVLNLLTNAVKYTKEGEISLAVTSRPASDEEILLGFRVSDTGIGMKEEDLEKLFAPFTRIEEKRNRSIEGTGLGMSIVQQLLSLMDSHLEVESEYGKGSAFSFEIRQQVIKWDPIGDFASRLKTQSAQNEGYRELFHAPDARILVVDDTEVNLTVIQNLLKQTKLRVDTAGSGREALSDAKETRYDMIFIDHMMPDMDGIETLQRLKEEVTELPPCIALTANAVSGAREEYLAAGFSDYLSKPVNGRRLEEMLKAWLPPEKLLEPEPETGAPGTDVTIESAGTGTPGEEQGEAGLPSWLCRIPEIDAMEGLANCGGKESYLTVLATFHRTAAAKADEIEQYCLAGEMENYTIKVHALKSAARIIGAKTLSGLARELEDAGNAGDTEKIGKETGELLAQYRTLDEKLSAMEEKKAPQKEFSDAMRKDAFRTITEIAECMDFGMMEEVLGEVKKYRLSEEDQKTVKEMETLLLKLDWEGIGALAAKALQ